MIILVDDDYPFALKSHFCFILSAAREYLQSDLFASGIAVCQDWRD